jgi:hypothetical protein
MTTYQTRSDTVWSEDQLPFEHRGVYVDARPATYTGLVTKDGLRIYRNPEPIGFLMFNNSGDDNAKE